MHRMAWLLSVLALALCGVSCFSPLPPGAANPEKLHLAASAGDRAAVDAALKAGSKIDQVDGHGKTPLSFAAAGDNAAMVAYLLDRGADPNHVAEDGDTPLLVAARKGNAAAADVLVQRGARIDAYGEDGFTALTIASAGAQKGLFDLLLKLGARPNVVLANCDTALIASIPLQDPYFVDRLIAAGADPNLPGRGRNTPLIIAAYANKPDIAEKLMAKGARVNDVNAGGYCALHFAAGAQGVDPAMVRLLVEKGADVNRAAGDGLTPMKAAGLAGRADTLVYLYEKGAHPQIEESTAEGRELNGKVQHFLTDYYLAQDQIDKARASCLKAKEYYRKTADRYKGDISDLEWKQASSVALAALGAAMVTAGVAYDPSMAGAAAGTIAAQTSRAARGPANNQAGNQSQRSVQGSSVQPPQQGALDIQGYTAYRKRYDQPYVPTYRGVNGTSLLPPSDGASSDQKKAYAREKAREYEKRSLLMDNVLACIDKHPKSGADMHACVNAVIKASAASDTPKK